MNKNLAVLLLALAAGCSGTGGRFDSETMDRRDSGTAANPVVLGMYVPPMDPKRKVSEQDCSKAVDTGAGNLMCKGRDAAAERRAKIEEERQAKARIAAEERAARERAARERLERERAARERLERERAEQVAREEAVRKARAAEEERLAAERRRLEEEAARKAREERERQEREEAEARARQRAEQEAREAAERERRRLEQEWLAGRALLERFVATYGKVEEFKDVAEPITGFLDKTRNVKR